jgi:DNA repair photolyase
VCVNVAPMIPGLGEEDIAEILTAAAAAGARRAAFIFLRLPGPVATVFQERVREALPLRAERILSRVREARKGKLYDSRWGKRQQGEGPYAESARALFDATCRRLGLNADEDGVGDGPRETTFQRPPRAGDQMKLFD